MDKYTNILEKLERIMKKRDIKEGDIYNEAIKKSS